MTITQAPTTLNERTAELTDEDEWVIAPGETLARWLRDNGRTQKQLARQAEVSVKHVNMLIHGRVALTAAMAIKLEDITAVPARVWCGLEADFRIGLLRGQPWVHA